MTPNPREFIDHLKVEGYFSRIPGHGNALGEIIVDYLLSYCPQLAEKAENGQIVYDLNFDLRAGNVKRNVDLVIGRAPLGMDVSPLTSPRKIVKAVPSTVYIAIEIKCVFTKHTGQIKNRMHDFDAHHAHVHQYNNKAIAGGFLVLNSAREYISRIKKEGQGTYKPNNVSERIVEKCVGEMRSVLFSEGDVGKPGLDAKGVMVVNCDNIDFNGIRYDNRLSPSIGDPLHFDSFINTICDLYKVRFS